MKIKTIFTVLFSTLILFGKLASQNWSLGGNSNVGANSFLGSTNLQNLIFRTNNLERMRITSGGLLGINTGGAGLSTGILTIGGDPLANNAGIPGTGGFLVLGNPAASNLAFDNNDIMARSGSSTTTLGLQADGGAIMIHGSSLIDESQKVLINSLGLIGIGNTNPQAYLHIKQAPDKPYGIKLERNEGTHTPYELFIGSSKGLNIKNATSGNIEMIFGGDGNIGIGTLGPQTPLHLRQQNNERGLRFQRDDGVHDTYELRLAGSTGFHVWNVTDNASAMVFNNNRNIGIGMTAPTGRLHIEGDPSTNDASLTGSGGYLVLGNTTGPNLALDNNEIMARGSSGASANLGLQADGGSIIVHGGSNMADSKRVIINENGVVGIGTTTPNASAALDIQSTNQGVLVPRLTTAQRTAISSPATGLLVYDSDLQSFFFHNGTSWTPFIAGSNNDADADPTNELQNWGNLPGIPAAFSDGTDDVNDADADPTNELQNWGNLPGIPAAFSDGTDDVDDADADPTNELQNWGNLPGIPAAFSDGTDDVNDADANIGNEYNTSVSLTGNTLSVVDGGGAKTVDLSSLVTVEADPQVGSNTTNYLPKWNGSALVQSTSVFEDGSGNVRIGTTPIPVGYKLAVDGKIIATELKIKATPWPDYVLEKDYPLLPLKELEQSIQQNGHLPGIPSAAEVEANGGVEVGDMQRRLLEKVEELTLYMLQLKKENDELKKRIEVLEK